MLDPLTTRDVAKTISRILRANGLLGADVEDARQEVLYRVLRFRRRYPASSELRSVQAFCATVTRNYLIDEGIKAERRREDVVARCTRKEYGLVEHESVPRRDPVDARRQLEVVAGLFREGRMPERGVEILEGLVSKCSMEEIGQELGLTLWAVRGRIDTMRKRFREQMARLGILPSMQPLMLVVSSPTAIAALRKAS